MIDNNLFREISTNLDLNGPNLSFTTQPVGVATVNNSSVTFIGIATATFPQAAANSGSIVYQWYDQNGAISNGTYVTGAATTTLTISNVISPTDSNRQIYLQADYVPYQTTGNALNEPTNSNVGTLTVYPVLSIVTQPVETTATINFPATFNCQAVSSDGSDVSYQWQLNGKNLVDGSLSFVSTNTTLITTYTTDTIIVIPSNAYGIQIIIAGSAGSIPGAGRYGVFTLPDGGRTLNLTVKTNSTGKGGSGGSPVGGSGGSASAVFDVGLNSWIIIAGGGAGGVGSVAASCSGNPLLATYRSVTPVYSGSNASAWSTSIGTLVSGDNGSNGALTFESCPGGDEGYYQNAGSGGTGGGSSIPGGSAYNSSVATLLTNTEALNNLTGYITVTYTVPGHVSGGTSTQLTSTTIVSGATTPNLTLSNTNIGTNYINCKISHPTSTNSPIYSNFVNFYNVPPAKNITIEKYDTTSSTITSSNTHDLLVSGDLTLLAQDNSSATSSISLYAPEMNINVEMEIYGGAGANSGSNTGGQGGFSKVRFTMNKNVEYTIAGLDSTNQCPFVYRKGSLIAVCGKGGDAASGNNGGAGGGINVAGASGGGSGGGSGGVKITTGALTTNGIFGSSSSLTPISPDTKATGQTGGKTISCPKGNYWISRGYSACQDVGTSQIYLANGTLVTNSALITRGFKSGYDIRQTAGLGQAQYSTQVPYTDTCYNTGGSSGYRWEMRYALYQTGVVDNAGSISYNEVRKSGPSGYAPQNVSGEINTIRTINGDDRYYTITATNGITQTNGYVESGFFTNTAAGQFVIGGIRVDSVSKVGDAKWEVRFRRNDNNLPTFNRQFTFTITGQQNFWVPYDDTYSNPYPCTQYRTVTVSGSGSGGSGATGGNGGTNSSGGGGGSGYTDGSVTVVSTQQGGNIGGAKIIIRAV